MKKTELVPFLILVVILIYWLAASNWTNKVVSKKGDQMDNRIDFDKEVFDYFNRPIPPTELPGDSLKASFMSIATRVEEDTIQRCYRILLTEEGGVPRLYASKPKTGEKSDE